MEETVIVEVGGEGGSVTLLGRRGEDLQWQFHRTSTDSSWSMLDEEEGCDTSSRPAPEPVWVGSWTEAIALLDRNPWAQLVPLSVHVDFRQEVLIEVTRGLLAEPSSRNRAADGSLVEGVFRMSHHG
jgi:hypothetical protein